MVANPSIRRRFEFSEGSSNKFWEIEIADTTLTVCWGRIGTGGKTQTKCFANPATARAEADKLIAEKLRKGYSEANGGPPPPTGPMDDDAFWAIIAKCNWHKTGDDDAVLRPAVAALARRSIEDIYAFDEILAAKLYALDTREFCRQTYRGQIDPDDGEQYVSADDFLYARCVVVGNGKEFYESMLADASEAPQDMEFEALLGLAAAAYEKKTGEEYDHSPQLSWESFSNQEGWKPTASTRPGMFTDLAIPPGNRRPT
jgi:predicted DNA-binding WGR domain protein